MPPAKEVEELVAEVKSWYEANRHNTLQRDLAAKLGVSPTGLCQIFAGKNQPSASTTLAMIQLLQESNIMKTLTDPPRTPPTTSRDNEPKTLLAAKERIAELTTQLKAQTPGATTGVNSRSPAAKATQPQSPRSQSRLEELRAQSATAPRGTGMVFRSSAANRTKSGSINGREAIRSERRSRF